MSDSASTTKQKLVKAIYDFHLIGNKKKLTVKKLCEIVGISRQAFHRNYAELKPYVTGKLPIHELMKLEPLEINNLLTKTQEQLIFLQNELDAFKLNSLNEMDNLKKTYVTSLMVSDLMVADTNELHDRIEKQALHNNLLVKEIQKLQLELVEIKAKKIQGSSPKNLNKIVIDFPVDEIYQRYFLKKNIDELEDDKDKAFLNIFNKITQINKSKNAVVIFYIERFVASFKKFSESFNCENFENVVIVRAPIFSRTELKLLASKITNLQKLIVCYPFSISDTTIRAQRQFLFRNIPEIELNAADNMPQPLIQDGFDQVIHCLVRQGD